jgi:YjbE family integral membrane protein
MSVFMATIIAVFKVVLIDLVLSGDNAAVIGLAIRGLDPKTRKMASFCGAGSAVLLRVTLTICATLLIRIPWVNTVGGIILIWITDNLLANNDRRKEIKAESRCWRAVFIIIVADFSMSFDNIMGVAGAAHGSIPILIIGLLVSIPILMFGSNWIASIMDRHPIVIYLGGAVLAHTSVSMIVKGLNLETILGSMWTVLIPWLFAVPVFVWGLMVIYKHKNISIEH